MNKLGMLTRRIPSAKLTYASAVSVATASLLVLTIWRNPYGTDFRTETVPITLALASAQSLLLPIPWHRAGLVS